MLQSRSYPKTRTLLIQDKFYIILLSHFELSFQIVIRNRSLNFGEQNKVGFDKAWIKSVFDKFQNFYEFFKQNNRFNFN